MAKFSFVFVVALCLSQNFETTIAEAEENEANLRKLSQTVEQIGTEIKQIVKDISNRLPDIVKDLDKKIKETVAETHIGKLFDEAKKEIQTFISEESSITLECSKIATEELGDLYKKTTSDISKCVVIAQEKTGDIQNEVKKLMNEALNLTVGMGNLMQKCADDFSNDAAELTNCLNTEVEEIKKMVKQLKDAIENTVDITEKVSSDVVDEVGVCLKEVEIDSLINTEHVIDEVKECMQGA